MTPPRNLLEYEEAARRILPPEVYDYYAGGAEDEVTLRANRTAFEQYFLRQRVLVDVSRIDLSTEILGIQLPSPVLLAPAAFQRLANPEGELATARAAAGAGSILIASTLANWSVEDIASAASGRLWLQLYIFRDRSLTRDLVLRAENAGCRAICLTVTVPVQGNRERDARNAFRLPDALEIANFAHAPQSRLPDAEASALAAFIKREFDPSLTWDDVAWLRSISRLPIVVKGITSAEDALLAVEHGVDAIIVSNHGGRQLDYAQPTLFALPGVVDAVDAKIPVLLDGGVRRGTDVVKALALGASAVLIARPYLWGLAVGGEDGVTQVLSILHAEIERTLALIGKTSIGALDQAVLTSNQAM